MDRTFDTLTEAVRDGIKPSRTYLVVTAIAVKAGEGFIIGLGIVLAMAAAKAGGL